MKNLTKLIGITIFVVVIGFSMAACQNDTTPSGGGNPTPTPAEGWKSVTSLNQLDGTWKATSTNTENLGAEDGVDLTGVTAAATTEITMVVNASAGTYSMSIKLTIKFSGTNVDSKWDTIKSTLGDELTYADSTKTATMMISDSDSITLSDVNSANIQINSSGTKVKLPASFTGSDEMILTKS